MAKIPRLNKTILPVLADPANIGRQVQPGAFAEAGIVARGIGGIADIGVEFFRQQAEEQKVEQERLQVLRDQTELTRRSSEFQNKAFDTVQANREEFKNNPAQGVDGLSKILRDLGKDSFEGLTPENTARLKKVQEATIGRFELQERTNAVTQTRINIQEDINNTAAEYLASAALAGQNADFKRLDTIIQDVSVLNLRATDTFESGSAKTFSDTLEQGIAENFADGIMFEQPKLFLERLDEGFFSEIFTAKEISEKKTETEKFIKTRNEQASFNRSLDFLNNNPNIAKMVDAGKLDFNQIDELVAANDISSKYGEAKRQEIINGKAEIVTDPVVYGNLKAKVDRLLQKVTVTEKIDGETITTTEKRLREQKLEDALLVMQEIADEQAKGAEGGLKPSDGNTLTKMLQIGMSNSLAVDGFIDSFAVNHYENAVNSFEAQGLEGQDLLDALRGYAVLTDKTGVDELNDQLLEVQPGRFARILPGGNTAERLKQSEDLRGQIETISKINMNTVLKEIKRKQNPELNLFQGDLPNNIVKQGRITKGLPGGAVKADASITGNFKTKTVPNDDAFKDTPLGDIRGKTIRIFPDGRKEVVR